MVSSIFCWMVLVEIMVQAMTIAELGERGLNSIRSVPDFVRRPSDNQWRTHDVNLPGPPGTPQGDYRPTSRPNTEWHPNGSSGQQGPPGGRPAYTHPSWTPPTQSTSAPSPPPPQLSTPATQCPAIWQTIIADLNKRFLGGNGQCTDDARAAIRAAFHDCATWSEDRGYHGGCDGSLVSQNEFADRIENTGLADWSVKVKGLKVTYPSVSVADLLVVSASVAIVSCPGGPRVQTLVGRTDGVAASQPGTLPSPFADGETNYQLFLKKGINETELAGLMGAHTVSKAFGTTNITAGASQDTTPGCWDTVYYGQTIRPNPGMTSFQSDTSLANHPKVGPEMAKMINNKVRFDLMFTNAMAKMMLFGVDPSKLVDCTSLIPKGTNNNKREMRRTPINARIR